MPGYDDELENGGGLYCNCRCVRTTSSDYQDSNGQTHDCDNDDVKQCRIYGPTRWSYTFLIFFTLTTISKTITTTLAMTTPSPFLKGIMFQWSNFDIIFFIMIKWYALTKNFLILCILLKYIYNRIFHLTVLC